MVKRLIAVSVTLVVVAVVPSPADAAVTDVTIADNFYSPTQVTVVAGDDVKWTHTGFVGHTVRAEDGSFDSNPPSTAMSNGQTFTVNFSGPPRTVRYFCEIHGAPGGVGMSGSVIVTPARRPPANFDGDADSDISVFRPGGAWFAKDGLSQSWGDPGDIAVPATYDADSKTDIAIFRPSTGLWAIQNSLGGSKLVTYGNGSDIPVPADYDGDGKADVAIYRPSTGSWWVHRSSTSTDSVSTFGGVTGDIPVVGDYDGDGKADLAIFRGGAWHTRPSSGAADTAKSYGGPGDIPVPGSWDSDAKTDLAIYRPDTGLWAIRKSTTNTDTTVTYGGVGGDEPVPGDFDGDGKTDIAIFRPSAGTWFVNRSSNNANEISTFGVAGDVPLLLPTAIRRAFY